MMNNNESMKMIINMMRSGKNPQQMVMAMLNQRAQGNPFAQNLLILANNHDEKGLTQVAKNILKEKGLDFDKEFNSFKSNLGIK